MMASSRRVNIEIARDHPTASITLMRLSHILALPPNAIPQNDSFSGYLAIDIYAMEEISRAYAGKTAW